MPGILVAAPHRRLGPRVGISRSHRGHDIARAGARAWLSAWGLVLFLGVIVAGMLIPLALHWRRDWLGDRNMTTAAALVLAGGFILRMVIVFSAEGIMM